MHVNKAVAVDWSTLDFSLSNRTLADILGVRSESISKARSKYGTKTAPGGTGQTGRSSSGRDDSRAVKVAQCSRLVTNALATGKPPDLAIAMLRKALDEFVIEETARRLVGAAQ
jgi:hypothetical protein